MLMQFCNKCFLSKELQPDLQLYLSQCGHICCSVCLQEKCVICQHTFKPILINKDMPQSMAVYFEDPMKLYKRCQKIIKFQVEQQNRYFAYAVNTLPEELKKDQRKLNGILKLEARLDEELANERKRIDKLKAYISYSERKEETAQHTWPPPSTPTISSVNSSLNNSKSDSGIASHEKDRQENASIANGANASHDPTDPSLFHEQENSNDFTL